MHESKTRSPWLSPLWLAALVLLALNDHVFKGSALLPGWLTGKLSDFAGLVVAPVLAAALCRGPLRALRPVAPWLVVSAFVATELSDEAARGVAVAFAWFGVRARLWPDPLDLLALAVLPLTWLLLARLRMPDAPLHLRDRVVLACGLVACVATSAPYQSVRGPFLVNHSGRTLQLELRWLAAPDACAASEDELRTLAQRDAVVTQSVTLAPTETMRLALAAGGAAPTVGSCPSDNDRRHSEDAGADASTDVGCFVLELRGADVPTTLLRAPRYWLVDGEGTRCAGTIAVYDDPGDEAVVLVRGSERRVALRASRRVDVFEAP